MGRRNLSLCKLDGKYRIAQYGQWDGYPEGQGLTILEFCRDKDKLAVLKSLLLNNKVCYCTDEEVDDMNTLLKAKSKRALRMFGLFNSRDVCGKIFDNIVSNYKEFNIILLQDESGFLNDELFRDWAYCINFDNKTLEVYANGNHLIKTFLLDALPDNDKFIDDIYKEIKYDND